MHCQDDQTATMVHGMRGHDPSGDSAGLLEPMVNAALLVPQALFDRLDEVQSDPSQLLEYKHVRVHLDFERIHVLSQYGRTSAGQ